MSQKTTIGWCVDPRTGEQGHTWNPVRGCSRVSPGCTNCYAARMAARNLPGMRSPVTGEPFAAMYPTGFPMWTGRVELIESKLREPLKRRTPTLYFANSMSDLFHENLSDDDIDRVFAVMALCPQHLFLVLTKRAKWMWKWYSNPAPSNKPMASNRISEIVFSQSGSLLQEWPLPNVWLGVSAEDQQRADERIPWLLKIPAALRFVSGEPLLEDVDVLPFLRKICPQCGKSYGDTACGPTHAVVRRMRGNTGNSLDWVICSGEGGPGARPMHPDWARRVRDDCVAASVPYFFKGWGEWDPLPALEAACYPRTMRWTPGGWMRGEAGACTVNMARVGRKAAGRLLDGKSWSQMPEVT